MYSVDQLEALRRRVDAGQEEDPTPYGLGGDWCPFCGQDWKRPHYEECESPHHTVPAWDSLLGRTVQVNPITASWERERYTVVPDVGDTFTVTTVVLYRSWQWLPFPWKRKRELRQVHSYRVDGWLCRRPPRPPARTEQERITREILAELIAEDPSYGPRGFGPDKVPLNSCRPEEAEYVSGYGVAGTIVRVSDVIVTGRVSWPDDVLASEREHALRMAGEPLL